MATRRVLFFSVLLALGILLLIAFEAGSSKFNGDRAFQDVITQVSFGPRTPGSIAHSMEINYISSELLEAGWQVKYQITSWQSLSIRNIISYRGTQNDGQSIILGAHYDSRIAADQEPDATSEGGVPGANDGASGVAVLLELARTLPIDTSHVLLVFFDAEDNFGIEGWDGLLGSRSFVANLVDSPKAVIIVDMVGDSDLNLYVEENSDKELSGEIWEQAAKLGYEQFIPETKYSILDDHVPFLAVGIPAVDIIDFDYPFWHTLADTTDKVSPDSLTAVGDTLWMWIVETKSRFTLSK